MKENKRKIKMTQYLQIMDLGAWPNNRSLAEKNKMSSVEGWRTELKRTEAVIFPQLSQELKRQHGGSKSEVKRLLWGHFKRCLCESEIAKVSAECFYQSLI